MNRKIIETLSIRILLLIITAIYKFTIISSFIMKPTKSIAQFNSLIEGTNTRHRREPYYVDDQYTMGLDHFYIPEHYKDTLDGVLINHGTVCDRVEKLAYDITQDYNGQTIHILCVLKGGSTFFGELCSCIKKFHNYAREKYIPYTFDFVRVKSYEGISSTGNVHISGCDVTSLSGKHVLFVEDIIDTGLTMSRLVAYLNEQVKPASVRVASLLEKRTDKSCGFKADYVGFSIPDAFVVGYCLDYDEVYRDLTHIAVINKVGIDRFRNHEYPSSNVSHTKSVTNDENLIVEDL